MLEEYTQKDFKNNSKNYNVNIGKGFRTLHKKDGCHCANGLWNFIPFDSLSEVVAFEKEHSVNFMRCKNPACGFLNPK